jgi:di/tricarboxylate transporter
MSLAAISLAALGIAVVVSCTSKMNVGVLAIVMAWVVGVYVGGMKLELVLSGFPTVLFLTLVGMTLLFTQAQQNQTLDKIAHHAVSLCKGNAGLIPILFFVVAAGLASIGPGNIATSALLSPIAMSVAGKARIPAFLMAIMVGNGANAGALSPFAPTGIIATGLMAKNGLAGHEWQTYLYNLAAHAMVAFAGYFLFGGAKLFKNIYEPSQSETCRFDGKNWLTTAVITLLVGLVVAFKINVGMGAFAGAVVLALAGAGDISEAIKKIPWAVIVMVCGVSILTGLLEKTQGMALFTDLLANSSSKETITGFIALLTGAISVYSSTSGVVLPAFLPTVPGLALKLGADPMAIASAINVGGHLVDVSPLSTIGALCIAAAPAEEDSRALFNKMMAWGFSMAVVGAVGCWIAFRA